MSEEFGVDTALGAVFARALDARDPRFDGIFFVGITSTGIYCRPVCPARVSYPDRRRFFPSAAAAERAGYRPCLRCHPELAPGRAACDAVSRLARAATSRIAAGALNGRSVADLAGELGVGERHLRRVLEREMGVSPIELALTYRLLFARRLLANTRLSVTRIAYASGFQSLRRFNAAFRERYRSSPRELRRPRARSEDGPGDDLVRLSLAYRPPLDWPAMLQVLQRDAVRGIDAVDGDRYMSAVRVDGHVGAIVARDAATGARAPVARRDITSSSTSRPACSRCSCRCSRACGSCSTSTRSRRSSIPISRRPASVVRSARARVSAYRARSTDSTSRCACCSDVHHARRPSYESLAWRVTAALGENVDVGLADVHHLAPDARRVAGADVPMLTSLGVRERWAAIIIGLARSVAAGRLRLEPGADQSDISRELSAIGVDEASTAQILTRSAAWPDVFPAHDLTTSSARVAHAHRSAPSAGDRGVRTPRCTCACRRGAWRPTRRPSARASRARRRGRSRVGRVRPTAMTAPARGVSLHESDQGAVVQLLPSRRRRGHDDPSHSVLEHQPSARRARERPRREMMGGPFMCETLLSKAPEMSAPVTKLTPWRE